MAPLRPAGVQWRPLLVTYGPDGLIPEVRLRKKFATEVDLPSKSRNATTLIFSTCSQLFPTFCLN